MGKVTLLQVWNQPKGITNTLQANTQFCILCLHVAH